MFDQVRGTSLRRAKEQWNIVKQALQLGSAVNNSHMGIIGLCCSTFLRVIVGQTKHWKKETIGNSQKILDRIEMLKFQVKCLGRSRKESLPYKPYLCI